MDQNIIKYLEENKKEYSKESLAVELKKAGYAESDISEGIRLVFGEIAPNSASSRDFWNFREKKEYLSASEKWRDFALGLSMIVGFILGSFLWGILEIVFFFYLFNKRRYISIGILCQLPATIAIVAFISSVWRYY